MLIAVVPTSAQDISTPAVPLVVCNPLQTDVSVVLEQVGGAIEAGDATAALDLLSCALQIDPNNPLIYNDRGFIYQQLGDIDAAGQDFARALGLNPYSILPRLNLAGLQFAQQNFVGAYNNYLLAIRIDPSRTNGAFFGAGRALYSLERYGEAIPYLLRTYHASEQTTTETLDGLGYAGYAMLLEGRYDEAWDAFNMLTSAVGGRAVLSQFLQDLIAEVESLTNRPIPDAREACGQQFINVDPKNAAFSTFVEPGSELLLNGDAAGAIPLYLCARTLDPFDPIIHSNLGIAYDRNGDSESAVVAHNRAIDIDPYYAGGWINRGGLRVRVAQYDDAFNDLNRGLLLTPEDANGYYWRGIAYLDTERPVLAATDLRVLEALQLLQFNAILDEPTAVLLASAEAEIDLTAYTTTVTPPNSTYSVRVPDDWISQIDDAAPDQLVITPPDDAYTITIRLGDSATLTGRAGLSDDLMALTLAGADQGEFYGNFARIVLGVNGGWRVTSVDTAQQPIYHSVFDIEGDLYPVFQVSSSATQAAHEAGLTALYTIMETWTLTTP